MIFPLQDRCRFSKFHAGGNNSVDIFTEESTPISACQDGTIINSVFPYGGLTITLAGTDNREYYYAHLNEYTRKDGPVSKGDIIGHVGRTGNAVGGSSHLHFAISRIGGGIDTDGKGAKETFSLLKKSAPKFARVNNSDVTDMPIIPIEKLVYGTSGLSLFTYLLMNGLSVFSYSYIIISVISLLLFYAAKKTLYEYGNDYLSSIVKTGKRMTKGMYKYFNYPILFSLIVLSSMSVIAWTPMRYSLFLSGVIALLLFIYVTRNTKQH